MSLPHNLVRLGLLLFVFGTVTGLLLAATLGIRTGTVFSLLLILVALGMLLQSRMVDDEEDEDEEDAEDEESYLRTIVGYIDDILNGLIAGSVFFWALMAFVTHFFGYEFDRNTWLVPPIIGLVSGGWTVLQNQARSIGQILEQRAGDKKDE
jgi:uncharacterized membrane protein YfcA